MKYLIQNRTIQISLIITIALVAILSMGVQVDAQSLAEEAQKGVDAVGSPGSTRSLGDIIVDVVNIMLFAVGILSVIMVIIGGIRYVVSGGDATATKSARDTILYSIVGLVVAFVAWGLVNFVTGIFSS